MAKIDNQKINTKSTSSAAVYASAVFIIGVCIAFASVFSTNTVILILILSAIAACLMFAFEYARKQYNEEKAEKEEVLTRDILTNEEIKKNQHEQQMEVIAVENEQAIELATIAAKKELAACWMLLRNEYPEAYADIQHRLKTTGVDVYYQIEKPKEQKGYVLLKSGEQSPLFNVDDLKQVLKTQVQFGTGQNVTTATGETRIISIDNNKVTPLRRILVEMPDSPIVVVANKYQIRKGITVDSAMEWLERRLKYV